MGDSDTNLSEDILTWNGIILRLLLLSTPGMFLFNTWYSKYLVQPIDFIPGTNDNSSIWYNRSISFWCYFCCARIYSAPLLDTIESKREERAASLSLATKKNARHEPYVGGGRELKSLLCDPGPELRLGGREERRAKILKRDGGKKKLWIGCTMGGGCTHVIHGRSRTTVDPRITTMPGRIASGFHGPGRHCLHQARSAVRCWASRMEGGGILSGAKHF